ncbi:FHA domain-containing protein [Arthrobacter sp. AQ5-05]|uniref:FHA domain-containing protein n=1 Tax=Arthrobacter sp. AQ5-05 TaxID=2184581 RepID=UPI000DCAF901|nr:FHA domain-containing protein [Arthrobacter sp. AQ5-05]RAX47809.1 FHA domain-containing protein [Arthrobacter sp. AQ5-05]
MRFDIDLAFSVKMPSTEGTDPAGISGTVKADGKVITITADSLSVFPSPRSIDPTALNDFAVKLKNAGITMVIDGPQGTIASLGNVKPNLTGLLGSKSKAVRMGKLEASKGLMGRGRGPGAIEPLRIPGTFFPLLPTFRKRYRRPPTTTHYARGGGRPRIIFVKDSESWDGKAPKVLNVIDEVTEIGSAPGVGLELPGLEPVHARIVHNELDEYVLVAVGAVGGSAGLKPGSEYTLRSGARMELGDWRLVFFREEYADHGRPFGGRNGGELSFQKPQFNPRTGLIERDSSV